MGRKMQPLVLKQLHGNPSDHALPTDVPDGVGELWAPPGWFDQQQRLQWDYALENAPLGLLTATDREVLVIWCVASVEYARAVQEVRRLGQVVKTKEGNAIQNPFLPIVNKQAAMMLRAGSELGFSPASRMALGTPPEAAPGRYIGSRSGSAGNGLDAYLSEKPDRLAT